MRARPHTPPRVILSGSAAAILALSSTSFAADNLWTGTTDNNWNTISNWSLGSVPLAPDDAILNILTNFPVVTADLAATPRDIIIGRGAGANGRVDHRAGLVTGERLLIGRDTGTGVYSIANTALTGGALTGFGLGTGSLNIANRLYIGGVDEFTPGATGTFNVNTSGSVNIGNDLTLGSAGSIGVMNVDAGTITTGGWNFIGKNEGNGGGNGTLRMSGGTLTNAGARTFIGLGESTGSLQISGGTYNNSALGSDNFFAIGVNNIISPTTPTLVMTGGILNAARTFSIGGVEPFGGNGDTNFVGPGKGAATINGATARLNVFGEFWVGQGSGSQAELTVNAGTLSIDNWIVVGRGSSTGTVTMTGGTITKTGGGHMLVGDGPGSNGSMTLSGGTVSLNTGELWVGQNSATGQFDMSGGSLTVNNWTAIGRVGGVGTMNFTGGTFTKAGGGVFIIADPVGSNQLTTGILNQSGNSTLITNELWVGQGNQGNGTYNLSAGTVDSTGWIAIGREGATGVVNVSGSGSMIKSGANTSNIIVGSLGGNGTVNQTGGSVVTNPGSGSILMGENGGAFTGQALWDVSGGTVSTDEFIVGWVGGNSELKVRETGSVTVGHMNVGAGGGAGNAKGVVNQTGGTITSNTWIAVGIGSSVQAEYNLSGGVTNAAGFEVADTLGVVNVSGTGVLNVSGSIENPTRNGTGTFNISGGSVTAQNYEQGGRDTQVGIGVTNQTGGIVTVTNNLTVQRPAVGTGTYNLSGGTLAVNGAINGQLGTFTFTGGKITRSTPGVITYNGNLTTGAAAATLDLDADKTFLIDGALDNTLGLTLELTGMTLPDQAAPLLAPVTGSFPLGTITTIPAAGSFNIGRTSVTGFDNGFAIAGDPNFYFVTRINEDGAFNPLTQSVFWLDEDAGVVTLQYSIIPEPGSFALATLAGLLILGRRRRKSLS